ncbi:MAG TPA: hypothetical protein VLA78_12305 [Paracoccaceae bacterium]|nr:hypothetical protein [Paracoccaceae bacterium]
MTAALSRPARPHHSILTRFLRALPVIGWIARDMSKGVENVFAAILILVTCVVLAVNVWGIVALTLTAVMAVPVMFLILIRLTLG